MNDDVKALVEQLEAWAPLVSSGYEVPAAGQTMMNASRALTAQAEEIERSSAELEWYKEELSTVAGENVKMAFWISSWKKEIERLRGELRRIAEGNLGDASWQANYEKIRDVARAALKAAQEVKA